MAREFAQAFYNSAAWHKVRKLVINRDHGLCQKCGKPGYIVDHIIELTPENINDPEISLNLDNLQYLCLSCHTTKTFSKYKATRKGLDFDENGDLIQVDPNKVENRYIE